MSQFKKIKQQKCIDSGTNARSMTAIAMAALMSAASIGTTGCESPAQVEPDWLHSSDPAPSPSPAPSATPSGPPTSDLYTGPESVAKYVEKFVADAFIQGIDVTPEMDNPKLEIRIASLDAYGSNTIGLCETGGGKRRVTFDPDYWDRVSDTQKELLSHHELGHCVLYRGHRTTKLESGAYASIMYPTILSASTYTANYDYYQEELFSMSATADEAVFSARSKNAHTHICDHGSQR